MNFSKVDKMAPIFPFSHFSVANFSAQRSIGGRRTPYLLSGHLTRSLHLSMRPEVDFPVLWSKFVNFWRENDQNEETRLTEAELEDVTFFFPMYNRPSSRTQGSCALHQTGSDEPGFVSERESSVLTTNWSGSA
jgi:hypothetical protein